MEWLTGPIGTTLIGILFGVACSYFFYLKAKRDKEPCWSMHTFNLSKDYSETVEGLDIQYRGEKVKTLSISKVVFWNRGAATIHQTDLSGVDPLRLEALGEGRILNATVLSTNNPASSPSVTLVDGSHVLIRFDYLDRKQGFVIQVIHEGTSSNELRVRGIIKGVTQSAGYILLGDNSLDSLYYMIRRLLPLSGLVALGTGLSGLRYSRKYESDFGFYVGIIFCLLSLITVVVWYTVGYFYQYRWVPQGLEAFSTDTVQEEMGTKS